MTPAAYNIWDLALLPFSYVFSLSRAPEFPYYHESSDQWTSLNFNFQVLKWNLLWFLYGK